MGEIESGGGGVVIGAGSMRVKESVIAMFAVLVVVLLGVNAVVMWLWTEESKAARAAAAGVAPSAFYSGFEPGAAVEAAAGDAGVPFMTWGSGWSSGGGRGYVIRDGEMEFECGEGELALVLEALRQRAEADMSGAGLTVYSRGESRADDALTGFSLGYQDAERSGELRVDSVEMGPGYRDEDKKRVEVQLVLFEVLSGG